MMINRRRVYGGKSLPYDAEIEYLECSGTQYIITDVLTEKGLVTEIDFKYTSFVNNSALFGSWERGGIIYQCTLLNNKWYFGSYSTSESNVGWYEGSPNTDRHLIKLDGNGSLYQDGHLLATIGVSEKTSTRNIYIFLRNGIERNMASIKCYGVRCLKNDVLIADFIPVRVGNVGYMYDKVTKQLFGNAGTGSFILGPDV